MSFAETRCKKTVDDVWFTANVLQPEYGGKPLTKCELKRSMDFIIKWHEDALEDFISFLGGEVSNFIDV